MSLNKPERSRLLAELAHFYDELLRYRGLAVKQATGKLTKRKEEEFQILRLELQRWYGSLEAVIEEYGDRAVLVLSGREHGAFSLALGYPNITRHSITALDGAIQMVNKAIGKLQSLTLPESVASIETLAPPKAFIAHGGETPALRKLKAFLNALGVIPVIAEEEPSEDRSIDKQVDWCLDQSDCAIVLATKGDIDGQTGEFLPRGNILIEIGRCQERFLGRIVYLIQIGTKFPSNISEKVRARFSPQSMDKALIKVAKELRAFKIIRAFSPKLKNDLPTVAESPEWGDVHHPPDIAREFGRDRGALRPCSFFIRRNYESDALGRWQRLADIEVEVTVVDTDFPPVDHVYLIPSGDAPRSLCRPDTLQGDPKALDVKRQVSQKFAREWMGRELKGCWFYTLKKGVPAVYSSEYDAFLNRNLDEFEHIT